MMKIVAEYYTPQESALIYKTDSGFTVSQRKPDGETVAIYRFTNRPAAEKKAEEIINRRSDA
jgi:hypothetical protein